MDKSELHGMAWPLRPQTGQRRPEDLPESLLGHAEAICSGLPQVKQLSLGNTASTDNHVAVSSGSAVDQDIVESEAIFSLNCVSYWSHAYGLKRRLASTM